MDSKKYKDAQDLALKNGTLDLYWSTVKEADLPGIANWLAEHDSVVTSLNLSRNYIHDYDMKHLKNLKNLTKLDLSINNYLTDDGFAQLKDLENLTELNLRNTNITDAGLIHLKDLKNLTSLNLEGTNITNASLTHLKDMKNLTSLKLIDNYKITDAGMENLKVLKNLILLDLVGTNVSDDKKREMEAFVEENRNRLGKLPDPLADLKASSVAYVDAAITPHESTDQLAKYKNSSITTSSDIIVDGSNWKNSITDGKGQPIQR